MDLDLATYAEAPSGVVIEHVQPTVDGGRHALKREVGDSVEVAADIFREGHDQLAAVIQYRQRGEQAWSEAPLAFVDNDRWAGAFRVDTVGAAEYRILAWPDHFESWRHDLEKKLNVGIDIASEILEGRNLVEDALTRANTADMQELQRALDAAADEESQPAAAHILLQETLSELMYRNAARDHAAVAGPYPVYVDRVRARFAAWYSMFPRSTGTVPGRSGTFRDVEAQLPRIQEMGFNVLYFTPIHPIGEQHRKGKNNSVISQSGDPGVPYAIGSEAGGHDAIEPGLGTWEDFDHLVDAAAAHGLEIALDLAIQASPDHPWVREHPEWFYIRPDGTIKYAENPPKKYEDIYPINFNQPHWRELYEELYRVIMVWVGHGVTSIRVDNPHTKPVAFWEWLIAKVHETNPEVIFLSEAFTRPKVMKALAKAGFAQSYTYFTWRNYKQELIDYAEELTQTDMVDYFRGNFFTNTHDINPTILQVGGTPSFKYRLVLAGTLSSAYGIYSGFELCENTPVPGREEYLNSEKYELKVWDWDREGNIAPFISRFNAIRNAHPALQEYDNLRFFEVQNDNIIGYTKRMPDNSDIVVVMCNLNPFETHEAWFELPIGEWGIAPDHQFLAVDELNGNTVHSWTGPWQHLQLDPAVNPAMILHIRPWQHVEYVDLVP